MVMPLEVNMDDVDHISETTLTIRGSRRRTTVPKEIVDKMKLKDGDRVRWILFRDSRCVITRVK